MGRKGLKGKAFLPRPKRGEENGSLVTGYPNTRVNAVLALDDRNLDDPKGVILYYLTRPGGAVWCASDLGFEIDAIYRMIYRDEMNPEDAITLLTSRISQLQVKVDSGSGGPFFRRGGLV